MSGDLGSQHLLAEVDDDGVCGTITVDPNLLIKVIELTAASIDGISGIVPKGKSSGRIHSIVEGTAARATGSWHEQRGIRVNLLDGELDAELTISVETGVSIPDLARAIQTRLRAAVERLLGFTVGSLAIHVTDIVSPADGNERA